MADSAAGSPAGRRSAPRDRGLERRERTKSKSVAAPSHQLVVAAAGAAGDHDRAGLLEAAHDADDAALRLLDDAPALRRLEVDLLLEELGAALGHVRRRCAA